MLRVALLQLDSTSVTLGLGYLISWYNKYSDYKNNVEFNIIDLPREKSTMVIPKKAILNSTKSFDIVCIPTFTQDFKYIIEISNYLKDNGIKIILGGHHISALPLSLPPSAVIGVLGEAEMTFQEIIDIFIQNNGWPKNILAETKGICFHDDNGQVVVNLARERIKDIDLIPFPDRSYYKSRYFRPEPRWQNKIISPIITSRGCPYDCVFCSSAKHWTNTIKYFSAEYVLNEIKYLYNNYNVTLFQIFDDLGIGLNIRRLRKLRDLLKEEGMLGKIEFHAQCRVDVFSEELRDLLKELNFTELEFGIESGSQRILDYLKNTRGKANCTVEKNWETIKLCTDAGIKVWAQLIIGSPDETIEEVKETLQFTEVPGVRYQLCLLTPLPGTVLWENCKNKGIVSDDMDWSLLHLETNEETFFNRLYLNEIIPRKVLWDLIKDKLTDNVVNNELLEVVISPKTVYYALEKILFNPRVYLRKYSSKFYKILKYYFSKIISGPKKGKAKEQIAEDHDLFNSSKPLRSSSYHRKQ